MDRRAIGLHPWGPKESDLTKRLSLSYRYVLCSAHVFDKVSLFSIYLRNYRKWPQSRLLSVRFNSVTQSCPTLCNPTDCSTPGFPVHHPLLELAQTHVHRVGDAIEPSHPLLSPSPPAFNLSQHQGLFQWVSSSHQVAKVLELQHQSFQWVFRIDFL